MDARAQIEDLLRTEIGLDPDSIGRTILDRVVRERAQAAGFKDLPDYAAHLQKNPEALVELVEATVVPETWFFRDVPIFNTLVGELRRLARDGKGGRTPRLLSLPCSTGEEPYTIAMSLMGAGFDRGTVSIEGVDVCRRSIALAQRGLYGRNSFRGEELSFRERFFVREGARHQIRDDVRSMVRFRCGNVLSTALADELGVFDVVFCRNVLIYFDLASRDLAFATLSRLVREGGLLIVTPAEAPLVKGRGFEALEGLPISFFKRVMSLGVPKVVAPSGLPWSFTKTVPPLDVRAPLPRSIPFSLSPSTEPKVPVLEKESKPQELLEQVAKLADQGKLDEAERVCDELLDRHGPQAEAYYLMGLVNDARGRPVEAGAFYRKTLYLSPNHYEALVHLSTILEMRGQKSEAILMRQRAIRIQGK